MIEALELLDKYDDDGGLAESNVTSDDGRTIYHATAKRLSENYGPGQVALAYCAGSDRYSRPTYRITDHGRDTLAHAKETTP